MSEFLVQGLTRFENFCSEKDVWTKGGAVGKWFMHLLFDKTGEYHFDTYNGMMWDSLSFGHLAMYGKPEMPWTRHNQIYYTAWQEDEF